MAVLYSRLARLALGVLILVIGCLLWTQRGDEIAAAKARQAEAVQAMATAQVSLQTDQQTVTALQQQQVASNAALTAVGTANAATASTAATINAKIAASQDGPVAPVLAQTLQALAKTQGEAP